MTLKHSQGATPFRHRLEDPDESGLVAQVRHTLPAIAAIVFGAVTWAYSVLLLNSHPDSSIGRLLPPVLVFLAPILGVILPMLVQLLFRSSTSAAIWLFAVAPVLGGLDMALCILVIDSLGNADPVSIKVIQWLFIGVWLAPAFLALQRAAKKRKN